MEFRLVYKGRLPAAGRSEPRTEDKHRIRCELHSQLKTLWAEHIALKDWGSAPLGMSDGSSRTRSDVIADQYEKCGKRFLPLISKEHGLACELDILFLRRDVAGSPIIKGGDIDNRLKVLLDALKVPEDGNQIPNGWQCDPGENPLYCLMEDDSLITRISVTTDRLLLPLEDDENYKNVHLVIRVKSVIVNPHRAYIEMY